jgi:hypothetical protein
METLKQATEVIRAAEERLRELISQAAARAEYDHLSQLADWAKQLGAMTAGPRPLPAVLAFPAGERDAGAIERSPGPVAELPLTAPIKPSRELPRAPRVVRSGRKAGRTRKKSRPTRKAGDYPKFLREGESLVKIGWSKKEKATYEHKAPRRVLTALVGALEKTGRGGKRFSFEDLLPIADPDGGGEVPSYQAYLALAWMRTEALLTQHGRQGYSIPDGIDLSELINTRWEELTTR